MWQIEGWKLHDARVDQDHVGLRIVDLYGEKTEWVTKAQPVGTEAKYPPLSTFCLISPAIETRCPTGNDAPHGIVGQVRSIHKLCPQQRQVAVVAHFELLTEHITGNKYRTETLTLN
jgi:hypothetical protein